MKTDDLIALLATGTAPVERHPVGRRYALAIGLGLAASGVLMLGTIGLLPDLAGAVRRPSFWVKVGFVATVAWGALVAAMRLSRPGPSLTWLPAALAAPVLAIWVLAAAALAGAAPGARAGLVLGTSWWACPWLIALLSLPVLVGVLWAMRGLAPTRLALAGTAAGLLAGALGALVYCLHCPEQAAPFVGSWYLLGMLIPSLVGALSGPVLLRW